MHRVVVPAVHMVRELFDWSRPTDQVVVEIKDHAHVLHSLQWYQPNSGPGDGSMSLEKMQRRKAKPQLLHTEYIGVYVYVGGFVSWERENCEMGRDTHTHADNFRHTRRRTSSEEAESVSSGTPSDMYVHTP